MAFEAGRGTGRTPRDSEGTRRTALPDPRGLPTDAGRNWRRTLQDLEGRPVLPGLLHALSPHYCSGELVYGFVRVSGSVPHCCPHY